MLDWVPEKGRGGVRNFRVQILKFALRLWETGGTTGSRGEPVVQQAALRVTMHCNSELPLSIRR